MISIRTLLNHYLAFEKKSNKEIKKKKSIDNNDDESDKKIKNNNIKVLTFKKDSDSHLEDKNIIIHNNINNINININLPYNDRFNKKRPRGNSMDILYNNYDNIYCGNNNYFGNQKIDDDFQSFFESFKCEKYDEDLCDGDNLYETFLQFPNNEKNCFNINLDEN